MRTLGNIFGLICMTIIYVIVFLIALLIGLLVVAIAIPLAMIGICFVGSLLIFPPTWIVLLVFFIFLGSSNNKQ